MNIVFSTTRQWNPGDEFILLGCINLLHQIIGDFNPIIYNRNPQIRRSRKRDIIKAIDNFLQKDFIEKFLDNSVKERPAMDYADMVVFAGSPEWRGRRLTKLYSSIVEFNIPTLFLGLGSGTGSINIHELNLTKDEMSVLTKSGLITCRDCSNQDKENTEIIIHNLPCPALYSSNTEKKITQVKKIGLIYGTYKAVKDNNVSKDTYEYLMKTYNHIIKSYGNEYEIEFIAHYIDELTHFPTDFPNQKIKYSYDSKDYLDIYSQYDLVIGHRVHGIGISASMAIPGIMILHDSRSQTVKGFAASIVNVGSSLNSLDTLIQSKITNISNENFKLMEHKKAFQTQYLKLLSVTCNSLQI